FRRVLIRSEEKAKQAIEAARSVFKEGATDENMPTIELDKAIFEEGIGILNLLTEAGITKSNGEGRRLVQQNGISINGEKATDIKRIITMDDFKNDEIIIQKGIKVYQRVITK